MSTTKFEFTKFGLKRDPRGAHVLMTFKGEKLLGVVKDCYRDEVRGASLLKVTHLNGEAWPFDPSARVVDVLVRN